MASYSEKMAAAQAAAVATAAASEEVYTLCQDGRYLIYTEYSDDNFSSIDISKNINVDKTQVNLVGEENAQYIPFKIKRYWDGIDLMDMLIQIHYQNSKGNGDINTAVNVRFSDEYITFGWLVKSNVTAMSGDVTFEITAVGVNEKGDNYRWRTKPNGKIKITEALTHDGMIEPSDDWYTSFEGMILGYVNQAKAAADEAKSYADQINVEDVKDAVIDELQGSINSTLANYYTKTEIDTALDGLEEAVEAIDGLDKLSMTYNGTAGVLQLFNDGVALGDSVTINSLKNLKVTYTVENGIGTLTFKDGSKTLQTVQIGSIDPSKEWTDAYTQTIEKKIAAAVKTLSDQVTEHVTNAELQFTNLGATIAAVGETLADDYYDKTTTDSFLKSKASAAELTGLSNTVTDLQGAVSQNTTNISSANSKIASIEAQLSGGIDTNYNIYDIMLETNDQQENVLLLLEGKKGEEGSLTKEDAITTIVLPAGSGGGGGGGTSYIKIQYVTPSQVIATTQDDIIISYKLETLDIDGDTFTCDYTWTLDGDVIATGKVSDGVRSFDVTDFMTVGTKELVLTFIGIVEVRFYFKFNMLN